jgi:hypothetical protein
MNVLIVGGNQVESLKRQVVAQGYTEVEHWHGRSDEDCCACYSF